jgi:hypothetical protein
MLKWSPVEDQRTIHMIISVNKAVRTTGLLVPGCPDGIPHLDAGASTRFLRLHPGAPTRGAHAMRTACTTRPTDNTRRPLMPRMLSTRMQTGIVWPTRRHPVAAAGCGPVAGGPIATCATPDLLLQHLDKTLATYVRKQLKHLEHTSKTLVKHLKTLESHCKYMQYPTSR